ncbi:hypothetical protein LCGC14_0878630 [marine sediment metagenome]|uniref:Calcineurin-like phosphoesterase domain-containing protein n=1 Tax=marine sediment metagenome TaxID=412755 RepID=A0A0F9PN99_9ZZZZ|nr:hypothetical protein [Phycisphaerae bacterium]
MTTAAGTVGVSGKRNGRGCAAPPPFTFEPGKYDPNVAIVHCNVKSMTTFEQWFLCFSDQHWDNPFCDRELLTRVFDQAVERGAGIIIPGDFFCAMQGKWDKRADKSMLRPEHQTSAYLDSLVTTAADWLAPYAHNLIVFGYGNHETSIQKRHETDLLERLVATLNDRTGSHILTGGYSGWVKFRFKRDKQALSRNLWYFHGSGGGGPVTKDMIQRNRQMQFVGNADIMCSGHTHDQWSDMNVVLHLNDQGRVERREMLYLKLGCAKDDYGSGAKGWHVETGKPPKPLGGYWLRFYWDGRRGLCMEERRAR